MTGIPVLGIMYPSITLAEACDPLRFASQQLTLTDLRDRIKALLADLLASLQIPIRKDAPVDEKSYWAAPILIDLRTYPEAALTWWQNPTLAASWAGTDVERDEDEDDSVWAEQVAEARQLSEGRLELGRMPDDLLDVLTDVALAGPGL